MKTFLKKRTLLICLLIVITIAVIGTAGYYYWQYEQTSQLLKSPILAAEVEAATILADVSKLIDLPKDEQPTFATVTDYTKLANQPFFVKAQNGDKVLIYTQAKEAVLYRPSANRIITVGPINIGATTTNSTGSAMPQLAILRVALYNGTMTTGLTKRVEQKLKTNSTDLTVTIKTNAAKSDYTDTLIIPFSSQAASVSSQIAQVLGGQVGSLPAGEIKPKDVDVLVIVGKNYSNK